MKIGLYGGSFNPPHSVHTELASLFAKQYGLDVLYICPNNSSAFYKETVEGITPEHRYNMCRIAFAGIAKDLSTKVIVSDMEIRRGGNTYTVDTVEALLAENPDADRIFVLCGTDMIKSLPSWHNAERLFELATFVHARRGEDTNVVVPGARILPLDFTPKNISSSQIRSGKDGYNGCLREVLDYMNSNLLYHKDKVYDIERIKEYAKAHEKETRYIHTLGVVKCALEMRKSVSPHLSENTVEAAALLHDITKILTNEEHIAIFNETGFSDYDKDKDCKIFHSRSGAMTARKEFGVSDAVYGAIYRHTTGAYGMNILDKIIYLADYIEENRTYTDCVELRNFYQKQMSKADTLAKKLIALDTVMKRAMDITIEEVSNSNKEIHKDTIDARDFIINETKWLESCFE